MAYATQSDLTPSVLSPTVLLGLTDDDKTGQINAEVVTDKLAKASGVVEMYCRERYLLPLQLTAEVTGLTTAIAAWMLYGRRSGQVPEVIRQSYEDAMRMLRDVAARKVSLDQPIGTTQQSAGNSIGRSRREQIFSGKKMEGYF